MGGQIEAAPRLSVIARNASDEAIDTFFFAAVECFAYARNDGGQNPDQSIFIQFAAPSISRPSALPLRSEEPVIG
jgi:hypothetical protein